MGRITCFVLGLAIAGLAGRPACADFRVAGPSREAPIVSDTPHVDPGDRSSRRVMHGSTVPNRIRERGIDTRRILPTDTAQGFGEAVPLSFACRQIVPAGIQVVYGSGVDPQLAVNWIGGKPWAVVLRDALMSTGLVIVPRGRTIEIRR